jgi:molecular chaperone DnaK (HSP70)
MRGRSGPFYDHHLIKSAKGWMESGRNEIDSRTLVKGSTNIPMIAQQKTKTIQQKGLNADFRSNVPVS